MNAITLAGYDVFCKLAARQDELTAYSGELTKYANDDTVDQALLAAEQYICKHAADIRDELAEVVMPYLEGYADMLKTAQQYLYNPNATYSDRVTDIGAPLLRSRTEANSGGPVMQGYVETLQKALGPTAGTIAGIGSYFIPGVGTVASGYDALASFANMFGKNLTWKQRLGHGLSGLLNTGLAAAMLVPGVGGLGKILAGGSKHLGNLAKLFKGSKALTGASEALAGAAKSVGNVAKPMEQWVQGSGFMPRFTQYFTGSGKLPIQQRLAKMPGLTGMINPWSKASKNIWQHGLAETMGQAGLGSRAVSSLGGIAMHPMTGIMGGFGLASNMTGEE